MENLYAIDCDLFPKNKIIEVLKYNNYCFSPDTPKSNDGIGGYLSYNEDKMWFVKKLIVLNHADFKIEIGNTYREDMSASAFQIYFPNQTKTDGFNYNAEFSKSLIELDDFNFDALNPIIAINLHKKNIDKLISEDDITFENTQIRTSKRYKPMNFEEAKRKGVGKLFLYKQKDFFIVIGWILHGRRNRNTVIYNKPFTEFLMEIESIDLKIPEGFDKSKNNKQNNKIDNSRQENKYIKSGNLINPFKNELKSKLKEKNKLYLDKTPNIEKINTILDKISRLGIDSLSVEEKKALKNNSDNL